MMGKREAVRAILEGRAADRIPVIMNACSLPVVQYGYTMPEVLTDPQKMKECVVGTRRRLGYDGLFAGTYSICGAIAGHLPNEDGERSVDGNGTIKTIEDLERLRHYDPSEDPMLQNLLKAIALIREEEPDEPIYAIVMHPSSEAFSLLGAKPAFKAMIKNPELFRRTAAYVEDAAFEACKMIASADIDFLWYPTPNFGGYCISRKAYERCIYESNVRYMNRMKRETDAKIILHPCGLYDDRLDLVLDECGDAWHIADTSTKKIKELYGKQVSLMGCIPSVSVMLEATEDELYRFAYQECMDGAADGRFILSPDCDVPPSTPDVNMKAVVRAAKDAEKLLFG